MVYQFDLDGTLCEIVKNPFGHKQYEHAKPLMDRIAKVNKLYDEGHLIKIETARGAQTNIDWNEFTKKQLAEWGLKYHVLRCGVKMHAQLYIDDKGITDKDFFKD